MLTEKLYNKIDFTGNLEQAGTTTIFFFFFFFEKVKEAVLNFSLGTLRVW